MLYIIPTHDCEHWRLHSKLTLLKLLTQLWILYWRLLATSSGYLWLLSHSPGNSDLYIHSAYSSVLKRRAKLRPGRQTLPRCGPHIFIHIIMLMWYRAISSVLHKEHWRHSSH